MNKKSFPFIGVGSPVVDTLIEIDEAFLSQIDGEKGGMILINSEQMQHLLNCAPNSGKSACGGSAGNTAFAIARLGMNASFLGKVGNDEAGLYYMNTFGDCGGDTSRFKVGHHPNARCLSFITPDSQRTLRTDLGAAATLSPDEISTNDFTGCSHVHIEGYLLFNRDLITKVLQSAKKAESTISIDLASFEVVNACRDILADLIRDYVDIIISNEDEAVAFSGNKPLEEIVKELGTLAPIAVVNNGAKGSFIAHKSEVIFSPALSGIKAIDTTGAGDYWTAGFLYGWLNGKSIIESAQFGSILGANIVQVIGASLPDETWAKIRDVVKI